VSTPNRVRQLDSDLATARHPDIIAETVAQKVELLPDPRKIIIG
jgi:hypothetical protein